MQDQIRARLTWYCEPEAGEESRRREPWVNCRKAGEEVCRRFDCSICDIADCFLNPRWFSGDDFERRLLYSTRMVMVMMVMVHGPVDLEGRSLGRWQKASIATQKRTTSDLAH